MLSLTAFSAFSLSYAVLGICGPVGVNFLALNAVDKVSMGKASFASFPVSRLAHSTIDKNFALRLGGGDPTMGTNWGCTAVRLAQPSLQPPPPES